MAFHDREAFKVSESEYQLQFELGEEWILIYYNICEAMKWIHIVSKMVTWFLHVDSHKRWEAFNSALASASEHLPNFVLQV